jgi:hypothetical protein
MLAATRAACKQYGAELLVWQSLVFPNEAVNQRHKGLGLGRKYFDLLGCAALLVLKNRTALLFDLYIPAAGADGSSCAAVQCSNWMPARQFAATTDNQCTLALYMIGHGCVATQHVQWPDVL